MDDWLSQGLKIVAGIAGLAVVAFIWEKARNAISQRVGLGGFYNRLPQSADDDERIMKNLTRLSDYLRYRSTEHGVREPPASDWEWQLGDDLKRLAELAQIGLNSRY